VPATTVQFRPWSPRPWVLGLTAAVLLGLGIGGSGLLLYPRGSLAPYEYHLWRWEANTILDNAFARLGIGPAPGPADGEQALRSYFKLTSQLRAAEGADPPNASLAETLTNERATYENDVERLLEHYIDEAITSTGVQRSLPLFSGVAITWPPVDFELTTPPQLLVRSPRARIARIGDALLKSGLTLKQVQEIEEETDSKDEVSLVVSIGGIAAYPAIIRDDRSYDSLLDTASHEWVHHYLAFYPLGQQFGNDRDGDILNETTANIAGREIGNLVRRAHPIDLPADANGNTPAGAAPTVDFNAEMRKLRLEVDALLSDGKVAEAEQTMEDRRKYLEAHGITIRRLNQAYFAFYGTYGNTSASSNPIGPKIERVWALTKDVGLFLKVMRDVESEKDLDAALARLEAIAAK